MSWSRHYAAEGKSLARVDGKVIFIENAIPGRYRR
jgi:tRNA/tmRNA/rRNA uracil-C5-methylase (TrmA/RlmC/RlmD family)